MKRNILTVILIICAFFSVYGQNSNPIDLIVLLNTSSEMSSSYDNVSEYLTGSFLSEFLRLGDTFHLIPFSVSPSLDLARRVSEVGDVETIIGRMLLQYPVENGSNVGFALSFAEEYITSLPSRPKKIVLVSTGASGIDNLIDASRQRLDSNNATLDFVQVIPGQPLTSLPRSGRDGGSSAQQTGTATTQQQSGTSSTSSTQQTETGSAQEGTGTSSETGASTGTQTTPPASTTGVSDTGRVSTSQETVPRESGGLSTPVIIAIAVLLLLLLGLIIFLAARKRGSGGRSSVSRAASSVKDDDGDMPPFVDHSKELEQYAAVQSRQRTTPYADRPAKHDSIKAPIINPTGPLLLNLFVEDQSTSIGKRNIHSLKSGYSLSIGGGASDFFIFLVSMPANIGEIRRNGSQCTFVPKKPKYFPDLGSSELRDCINKTIRIVSDKKYEMRIRFEMYEDPLVALNRVLMSIKVPG